MSNILLAYVVDVDKMDKYRLYVKVLCLVIVNVNVTKYVPQKCQM